MHTRTDSTKLLYTGLTASRLGLRTQGQERRAAPGLCSPHVMSPPRTVSLGTARSFQPGERTVWESRTARAEGRWSGRGASMGQPRLPKSDNGEQVLSQLPTGMSEPAETLRTGHVLRTLTRDQQGSGSEPGQARPIVPTRNFPTSRLSSPADTNRRGPLVNCAHSPLTDSRPVLCSSIPFPVCPWFTPHSQVFRLGVEGIGVN